MARYRRNQQGHVRGGTLRRLMMVKAGAGAQLWSVLAFAGAGTGAVLSALDDATRALLGVPVPVLLWAAAGAFLAITFRDKDTLRRTAALWIGLTLAGVFASVLAIELAGLRPTTGGAVAFFVSAGWLKLAPEIWPLIRDRWLGKVLSNKPRDGEGP